MATIENFATVSYTSNGVATTTTSNLAEIELNSSVGFSKATLGDTYEADTPVTYIITLSNSSATPISNVTITDDLGTFNVNELELTPLTFLEPANLLINGIDVTAQLTVDSTVAGGVIFTLPTLPADAVANVIYRAVPNEFAPRGAGNCITNTAVLTSDSECATGEAFARVCVEEGAELEVIKSMSPNPVVCGDTVTYTIRILNYGNLPAENVRLTDTFSPAPTNITVSRNGTVLIGTDYTYIDGTLTVPAEGNDADTVPAATFTRDMTTGEVTVSPGVVEYVVTGTI